MPDKVPSDLTNGVLRALRIQDGVRPGWMDGWMDGLMNGKRDAKEVFIKETVHE